ncbi:MAG: hypothetical protein ABI648_13585 [Betaproteobacteria bacterium]|jgi:hypothetical protein
MPFYNNYVIEEILIPAVFLFFLVSGIFGIGFGLGLALFQSRLLRLFSPMNRWISARQSFAGMDAQRNMEPLFHRHRRVLAAVFVLGGLFSIVMLAVVVDADDVATAFGVKQMSFVGLWAIRSATTLLVIGSLVAMVVGLILAFFPRLLGRLEAGSNRWISSRQLIKGVDKMHLPLDRWFAASPRVFGIILALAALVLAAIAATFLFGHR